MEEDNPNSSHRSMRLSSSMFRNDDRLWTRQTRRAERSFPSWLLTVCHTLRSYRRPSVSVVSPDVHRTFHQARTREKEDAETEAAWKSDVYPMEISNETLQCIEFPQHVFTGGTASSKTNRCASLACWLDRWRLRSGFPVFFLETFVNRLSDTWFHQFDVSNDQRSEGVA